MLTRLSRLGPALPRLLCTPPARFVSQSKPTGVAGSITVTDVHPAAPQSDHEEVNPYVKNPDYHGFSSDPVEDERNMRLCFFFGVSVVLIIGSTFLYYKPDYGMKQWARREAEYLIVEREKLGLPLISENYFDTSKMILSTDEQE